MSADIVIRPGVPGERPFAILLDGYVVHLTRVVEPGAVLRGPGPDGDTVYMHPTTWWGIAFPGDYARQLGAMARDADYTAMKKWERRSSLRRLQGA